MNLRCTLSLMSTIFPSMTHWRSVRIAFEADIAARVIMFLAFGIGDGRLDLKIMNIPAIRRKFVSLIRGLGLIPAPWKFVEFGLQ